MHPGRVEITKVVHGERAGMTHHAHRSAPQHPTDEMVRRMRRPIHQPEDSSVNPHPVAVINVVFLRLMRVSGFRSLRGGDVAVLASSELEQRAPVRPLAGW